MKWSVSVTYELVIEADDDYEAECWGFDHSIKNPQTGEQVQPYRCNAEVLEESKDVEAEEVEGQAESAT